MSAAIQVGFKSHRKDFFENKHNLHVKVGEHVIVQAETGVDLGLVTMTEVMSDSAGGKPMRAFVRIANPDEIKRLEENRADELRAEDIFRQKAR
jgi:cell fate regulator YaaT (PSP1 superfamily)